MNKAMKQKVSGNKKKWLTLGLVGAALLLVPRRSSRRDLPSPDGVPKQHDSKNPITANDTINH